MKTKFQYIRTYTFDLDGKDGGAGRKHFFFNLVERFGFRLLLRQIGIQTHPTGDQNCCRQYCCDDIFHFLILHVCPLFASV